MLNHLSVFKEIVSDLQAIEVDYDDEDLDLILLCSLPSCLVLHAKEKMEKRCLSVGVKVVPMAINSNDIWVPKVLMISGCVAKSMQLENL